MFGPWVEFGQGGNGILLEARDLDAPLPGSDPAMARHVKPYLEPILSQADATLSEQGRWVVYDLLVSHPARLMPRHDATWSLPQCSAERLGAALC